MVDAGIDLSTSLALLLIMVLGRPLTYTLKLVLPANDTLPSPSTESIGTLRSISLAVEEAACGSSSTL